MDKTIIPKKKKKKGINQNFSKFWDQTGTCHILRTKRNCRKERIKKKKKIFYEKFVQLTNDQNQSWLLKVGCP
jgi:hypothetical protein